MADPRRKDDKNFLGILNRQIEYQQSKPNLNVKKKKKLKDKDTGLMRAYGRDVERARTFQSDYSRKQPKKKYGIVDNILKKFTKT
tara:strand:- start:553 stop:807 length:255 start_codon:yes stop_codon:yes gene_type:complete